MKPVSPPAATLGRRIFISYPRGGATRSCAEPAERYLRERGARVFRDQTGIPEGDANTIARIEDELTAADELSASSAGSAGNAR